MIRYLPGPDYGLSKKTLVKLQVGHLLYCTLVLDSTVPYPFMKLLVVCKTLEIIA
jgi:hypothetical protein